MHVRAIARRTLALGLILVCSMSRHSVPDTGLSAPVELSAADRARLERKAPATREALAARLMSPMGAIAAGHAPWPQLGKGASSRVEPPPAGTLRVGGVDQSVHGAAGRTQTGTSLAVATNFGGLPMVAAFVDTRGFDLSVAGGFSISGVARSVDGGLTWSTPAQFRSLPVLPAPPNGLVFGGGDVKYDQTRNTFIYASVYVRPSDGRQGLCLHTSADNGATWTGPIEVGPSFVAGAAADQPKIDVHPVFGRLVIAWSQFDASPVQIRVAVSDNLGVTWSTPVTLEAGSVVAPVPRIFLGPSLPQSPIHVVWSQLISGATRNIGYSRSLDGGATWSAAASIRTPFTSEDEILGLDRVNSYPSMALEWSTPTPGTIHVVYPVSNTVGETDIAHQLTTNGGISWSAPRLINSDPGNDRAQFYPSISVDQSPPRRLHVIWYDQHASATGDVIELMRSSSSDQGSTWSPPVPVFDRPFHAGYGNDLGQPNLGDTIWNVAQGGIHHTLAPMTSVAPRFDEGQPSLSLDTPDVFHDRVLTSTQVPALRLSNFTLAEICAGGANGSLDPGETGQVTIALRNYVLNPISTPVTYTAVSGTLTSSTPGVTITGGTQSYGTIAPGATQSNATPFQVTLSPTFVPGTYVDLLLAVSTGQGTTELPYRLATGTPSATPTTLINQTFSVTPGTLPAGWTTQHVAGATTVPWTTSTALTASNAAFHTNDGAASRWERLLSPQAVVPSPPAGAQSFVTLDFDIAYNTEDEPLRQLLAYDGATVQLVDFTPAATVRTVLAEAFAEQFTTGAANHFPRHLPRNNDASYLDDMSVWAGSSGGLRHVSMKFPGAGLTGRTIALSFEYTEDAIFACATPPCGVAIDNVVLRHVISTASTSCTTADLHVTKGGPASVTAGQTVTYTVSVSNNGSAPAAAVLVTDPTPAGLTFVSNTGACATPFPCNVGNIAIGGSATITSTFSIPSGYLAPDPVVNTASATTTTPSSNPGDDSASASSAVTTSADVAVTRTGPATATPGAPVSYTVTVTNNGPSDAAGVQVTDSVPAGLTFTSNTGACTTAYPCALGTIPAGVTRTITSTYSLAAAYTTDPLAASSAVSATTTDPTAANNTSTASTPLAVRSDVRVTKIGPATVTPGGNVAYTIDVINDGPSDATGVTANDTAPAGVTFVSNTGACTTAFPCALGAIAAGSRKTFVATFSVADSYRTPDPLVNTATAASTTTDPDATNNTATAPSSVTPSADVGVSISGPPSIVPGQTADYTITVTNGGPSSADGVSATVAAPAGFTFVSNTGACTTAFPCALGSIASGGTRTFTARYSVAAGYTTPDPATSTATVSATTADPAAGNNTATASTPVQASADVQVTLGAPATVLVGSNLVYTITVTNAGPSDAQAVSVALPTPAGLTFVSTSGACTTALPCDAGAVAAGATATVTATFSVPGTYAGANPIQATASATSTTPDPTPANNTAGASTAVQASADLQVTLGAPASIVVGNNLVYTITVTNAGPSDAQAVSVALPTPATLTFVSSSGACTTAFPCDLGTLASGATATITATFSVPTVYTGPDPISATASAASTTADPAPGNNSATATTSVTRQADVAIAVSAPTTVVPGTNVAYTITVTNNGPAAATGVTVTTTALPVLTFVSNTGDCTTAFPCDLGGIPAGGTRTLVATYALSPAVTATPLGTAFQVSSTSADPDPSNNQAFVDSTVTPSADLAVSITGPATITAGSSVAYSISVTNNGPSNARLVAPVIAGDPALTFVSNAGACTAQPCNVGDLAPGQTATVNSTWALAAGAVPGTAATTSVTSASQTADPTSSNNTAQVSSTVAASANLSIEITGPASVTRGASASYAITVTNFGPSAASAVVVSSNLTAFATGVSNSGACTTAFPCDLGSIAAGGAKTILSTVTVDPAYALATLGHVVSVGAASTDPNPDDNVSTASSTVTSSADIVVSLAGPSSAERGKPVQYSINVRNNGPSTAEGVTLDDPAPAGLTFTSSAGDCATAFPCALGAIPPGGTRTVTATFTVNKDAQDGPITNTATVTATTSDPDTGNNTASVTLDAGATGCGCGQAPGATPMFLLVLGLVLVARRRAARLDNRHASRANTGASGREAA